MISDGLKKFFYALYEHRLSSAASSWRKPNHIGIILDGNRRYAQSAGMANILYGHTKGAEKLMDVLHWCLECKILVVTIWIFSLDNFSRDQTEVEGILQIIENKTLEYTKDPDIHKNEVKVRYIGRLKQLPSSLLKAIQLIEKATENYKNLHLNIAIAYGGREEITDAFREYLMDQQKEGRDFSNILEALTPEVIEKYLYTSGLPEPDLIIRTSGEVRLSGFLLWQSVYSEFYFCDTFWPAFRKIDFLRALRAFHLRKRRYGK